MVVLVPPPAPAKFVNLVQLALLANGAAMIFWSFFVFRHTDIVRWAEGRQAVENKTPFDAMIWRICGLWVFFAGSVCLNFSSTPVVAQHLAVNLVIVHFVETYVKCLAVGRARRATVAAAGNLFLGSVAFAALVVDSWLDGSGPLLDLSGVLSGGVVFFAALGWTVSSDPGYVLGALPSR